MPQPYNDPDYPLGGYDFRPPPRQPHHLPGTYSPPASEHHPTMYATASAASSYGHSPHQQQSLMTNAENYDDEGEDEDEEDQSGVVQEDDAVEGGEEAEENDDEEEDEDDEEDDNEEDDNDEDDDAEDVKQQSVVPRGKPEAMAAALAAARMEAEREELESERKEAEKNRIGDESGGVLAAARATATKVGSSKPSAATVKKPAHAKRKGRVPSSLLSGTLPTITNEEYENMKDLMVHFCRVPLLAEFSRPVALLHPELVAAYSKIVTHPVDLGHVCRGIRRRKYLHTRDVRLDMWRVFANCVKFHSHPNNKEAVPSFVSIALHLREFFNNLWQEYMLPSDLPEDASESLKAAFSRREKDRRKRLENSGMLVLNKPFSSKSAVELGRLLENGGRVDKMDKDAVFGKGATANDRDLETVVMNLTQLKEKLENNSDEYTLDNFWRDLKNCYSGDLFEDNSSLSIRVANRISRYFWKRMAPLHEANSRGVTQSSVWGNLAATIWARESSKKPYWPALCLGILPPEDQREGWHDAVTERNEARLPEKLRMQLMAAKKKCEQAQKRQSLSYFLVEFLGTHEFIWVRETDIVEKFDPNDDPNKSTSSNSKKKRGSRSGVSSVVGSKTYATALEECLWASDEYESVIQDVFDYDSENEPEEEEEINYSFNLLSQSDDEADEHDANGFKYEEAAMTMSEIDEAEWLLSHEGLIDTSSAGRKNAKKRMQELKKKAEKVKKDVAEPPKKPKSDSSKKKKQESVSKAKDREEKREQRDLEKRRKKRLRERERVLRNEARKQKRRRTGSITSAGDEDDGGLARDKRARATAIVKAYLHRMARSEDYKSLAVGGVMTIPAALVDSTGLLGMALAFRAAAGELNMPDDGDEHAAKTKPWVAIDTEKPHTSAQRIEQLKKQITLLDAELLRVRSATERRRGLLDLANSERARIEKAIESDDAAARQNHFKKKKKSLPKPGHPDASESPESGANHRSIDAGEEESNDDLENDQVDESIDQVDIAVDEEVAQGDEDDN